MTVPAGTDPVPVGVGVGCHGDRLTSAGETPLYWPCMEKPWRGKRKGYQCRTRQGPLPQVTPWGREASPSPPELPLAGRGWVPQSPRAPGGATAPYLVGREQDGAQGEARVVGDGGPLRRRLEREGRRWRG